MIAPAVPMTNDDVRRQQTVLRSRLGRMRRRLWGQLAMETVVEAVLAVTVVGTALVALDWAFRLERPARLILLTAAVLAMAGWLGRRAIRRWRGARLDDLSLAMMLDRFRPGTGQRIVDVLQLPDLLADRSTNASPALVQLAVRQAHEALDASDWLRLWNHDRTVACLIGFVATLIVPAVFAAVAPDSARLSLARWFLGSSERWPQQTYLSIVGVDGRGRLLAPRDEPFAVEVRSDVPAIATSDGRWTIPGRGEPLILRRRPGATATPESIRLREQVADGSVRDATLNATGPTSFRHELPPSTATTTFDLFGGDDWLGPITVERVDRPTLTATKLKTREPGTVDESFHEVDDSRQHLLFLPDTEIELTLVGSEPIDTIHVTVHPGTPPQMDRVNDRTFTGRWILREAITLEIQLTSRDTGLTSKPAFLSLGLLRDREPKLALRALGVGSHVTPVATIPLTLGATDDIGLAEVRLQADRTTAGDGVSEPKTIRKTMPITLPVGDGRAVLDHQARQDVELQADPPTVGTILRFVGEADDRSARGAQTGRSNVVQMQVVSPDELFYEILVRQRAERSKFVAAVDATEKQGPTLAGSPATDDYVAVLRSLHSTTRQLDSIATRIADSLQEMKLNQVGSPKSHRLLEEGVIVPLRALSAGPIADYRGTLQALAGQGPRAGADADSARTLHADVTAKMKVILDQMAQWESFVDVVNQVAEVIKIQQNVLKDTEKARDSRTQEVFDEKP